MFVVWKEANLNWPVQGGQLYWTSLSVKVLWLRVMSLLVCTKRKWRRKKFAMNEFWAKSGNSYWRGRLSTFDLLVLASLDQLILIEYFIDLCNKTSYLNVEVNGTEPSPSVSFPWRNIGRIVVVGFWRRKLVWLKKLFIATFDVINTQSCKTFWTK